MTETRDFFAYFSLALEIEKQHNINILCTDGWPGYGKYRLGKQHTVTKAETALVESKNSLIRHYLARFNRRTKRYSKAIDMIKNSLLLLFYARGELITTNI